MKKFLFILSLFFAFSSCSSSDDSETKKEAVLGVDNLSDYLDGKYFKFKHKAYLSGYNTWIFHFQSKGKRDVVRKFCGAFGEVCNEKRNPDIIGCHQDCRTGTSETIIIDEPTYLQYDDESKITFNNNSLYFHSTILVNSNVGKSKIFKLTTFSKKELDELSNTFNEICFPTATCGLH
jgi:hypothetical protein